MRDPGVMSRRLMVILGVAVLAAAVIWAVFFPPRFLAWGTPDALPADVAGQTVPPIVDEPVVRIAIAGDTGTGDSAAEATAQRMIAESESNPYDALILLGDLIYPDGDVALIDATVNDPFGPLVNDGAELIPVLGNHDYESGEQREILRTLGRSRPWYVEQVGPVRVVALDSNQIRSNQTQWLQQVLAEPEPPDGWTVVAMHHPAYSAGEHGSDQAVQELWAPIFAEAGVRLVLAGHDHDYQRSTPQDGVTYVVSGGGAKLRPTGRDEFTAVSASTLHYVDLLVYEDQLVGRAIDQSGLLVDVFEITR